MWSNEEITEAGDEALGDIEAVISDLNGIGEYEHIVKALEEIKEEIENTQLPYKERYEEELIEKENAEREYLNYEYEMSR